MKNEVVFFKKLKAYIINGGIFFAICFFPPVFSYFFALNELLNQEKYILSILVLFLILILLIFKKKKDVKEKWVLLFLSLQLIFSVELLTRLSINLFATNKTKLELNKMLNWSYEENQLYKAHPFLQYVGNSNSPDNGMNNFGFKDNSFNIKKPKNTIRIAAIGGSTTESGYPKIMETYLNLNKPTDTVNFQVYNFGISGWTSAHSLSNFVLNVVDFKPDYVIIHHGWNDAVVRNIVPSFFKKDYSHVLKSFEPSVGYDRYIIRTSAFYRYFKWVFSGQPSWGFLDLAMTTKENKYMSNVEFKNLDELKPFERNIQHIVSIAQLHKIKVILSTQPHTTNAEAPLFFSARHIDQTNNIIRKISEKDSTSLFLDLDRKMTGEMDYFFIDLGHMNTEGMSYKAAQFGKIILKDLYE